MLNIAYDHHHLRRSRKLPANMNWLGGGALDKFPAVRIFRHIYLGCLHHHPRILLHHHQSHCQMTCGPCHHPLIIVHCHQVNTKTNWTCCGLYHNGAGKVNGSFERRWHLFKKPCETTSVDFVSKYEAIQKQKVYRKWGNLQVAVKQVSAAKKSWNCVCHDVTTFNATMI